MNRNAAQHSPRAANVTSAPGRLLLHALVALTIIAHAGCMLGPRVEQPTVETPVAYRMDPLPPDTLAADSLLNLRWWDLFGDPALESLVERFNRPHLERTGRVSRVTPRIQVPKAS